MYYILNETDQVIAADDSLLTFCNVEDVHGLSSKIVLGDTTLTSEDDTSVTIQTNNIEQTFTVSRILLSSILGHMTLIQLEEMSEDEESTPQKLAVSSIDTLEDEKVESLNTDEDLSFNMLSKENDLELFEINETKEDNLVQEDNLIDEDNSLELFDLDAPIEEEKDSTETVDISQELDKDDLELFDLNEPVEEAETEINDTLNEADQVSDLLEKTTEEILPSTNFYEEDPTDIVVDVTKTSNIMGLSAEDYTIFLNEYIDTALELEEDLQSDDAGIRHNAIMTLSDLSEMMHLTEISDIMKTINTSTPEQQKGYIGYLYTTLSRLTTQSSANEVVSENESEIELFDAPEETIEIEETVPEKAISPDGFGSIDLSDVKAKHFDFQLKEAANDLSLPVELIEEFVHDFIGQAHVETKNMLTAYEAGNLEKIQSIGHLLKGASSNLRINALSDTLYKIQFCENEDGLDEKIKDYWAHFLSFENQINVISN